ncbi:ImmA/IrrE family metallo-endopeptidase [Leifsonia sp. TF02-11]|uniref:ImmA/IrrE family metallo-endopeptidase n=1 Tax=Leifsonia sp. TF02-11 TaxID=2815212 RepID=UPI001AA0C239|nr:ImmA/IrrE family metallo-endopeptidase [Leifsonia sp. TF02-11]MBO1739712.1 ImmA/IrrE family metallo-endopeptidase [Leifsonia sp. TF02-11]
MGRGGEAVQHRHRDQPGRRHPVAYDPWEHADELGIRVEEQTLRTTHGLYVPGRDLIILKRGVSHTVARCVLAHEIQHYLAGDRRVPSLPWAMKQERRADRAAARRLIDPNALFDLQQASDDPGVWAYELQVTGDILLAYLTA